MTPKPPRMTQMSWAEVREALEAHGKAISQLYVNCDALKTAIHGEIKGTSVIVSPDGGIKDASLVSPPIVAIQAVLSASFWGRLKWLLTGKVA